MYARVSTADQEKGHSLQTQLERCQEAAERLGYAVVGTFREDKSGKTLEREQLHQARNLLERGEADALFVYTVDRLSRELANLLLLENEFNKKGIGLYFVTERCWLGKTAGDNLQLYMMAIFGAIEREKIMERSERNSRAKIEGGKWGGQGIPPYGYRKIGQGRDGKLEIEEETATIVRQIFQWYAYGDGNGPLGTQEIARRLTAAGISSPSERAGTRGRRSVGTNRRPFDGWAAQALTTLLRRSAYSGVFYHYNYDIKDGKRQRRKLTDMEGRIAVSVPAIVDPDLFNFVQKKLDSGKLLSKRGVRNEYLMAQGRIRCVCGYTMQARAGAKINGSEFRYRYYKCNGAAEHRVDCPVRPFVAPELDQTIWDWLKSTWMDEDRLRSELSAQGANTADARARLDSERQIYADRLGKLIIQRKNYQRMFADEDMTREEYRAAIAENEQQTTSIKDELQRVESKLSELTLAVDTEAACALARALKDNLGELEHSFERRRLTIEMLNVRVELVREGGELVLWVGSAFRPNNERLKTIMSNFDDCNNKSSGVL